MSAGQPSVGRPSVRVLVVDDEPTLRRALGELLVLEGYEVELAADGAAALALLRQSPFDAVLTDLKMPGVGGLEVLDELSRNHPRAVALVMTGYGTVETAVGAMKRGATDYLLKPFRVQEALRVLEGGLARKRLEAENLRLRETVSLYSVSEKIATSLSLEETVETLVQTGLGDAAAEHVTIWLDDGDGDFRERLARTSAAAPCETLGVLDPEVVAARLADGPLLLHGDAAQPLFAAPFEPPATSVVVVGLHLRQKLAGWLAGVMTSPSRRFDEGQRKLLTLVAGRAAAALDNARLHENLQSTFQQTIESLAKTIDTMDHYTAGHSERVARYAVRLARWMGLSEVDTEQVQHAALMHDLGKVGCALKLNKPGSLTDDEYDVFKRHPVYGRSILEPIEFLAPVVPGVHYHHERWDGRGYPEGLSGKAIPEIARIISVADAYDAMTSDRAYRRALRHELAVSELREGRGSQFDPDIAALFITGIERLRDELRDRGERVPD